MLKISKIVKVVEVSQDVKVVEGNNGIVEFVETFDVSKIVEVAKICGTYSSSCSCWSD